MFCNAGLLDDCVRTEGREEMPVVGNYRGRIPEKWSGFNEMLSLRRTWHGLHFFLDDYQFERVWRQPRRYLPLLRGCACVAGPDFSIYADLPRPMGIWNVYRSRVLTAWWQREGIGVVPVASWSGEDSFDYAFDGLPEGGTIAVGTMGARKTERRSRLFVKGLAVLVERKRPSRLLLYGKPFDVQAGVAEITWIEPRVEIMRNRLL